MFPDLWIDEDDDEGKNINESPLIETLFNRYRRQCKFSYNKINDSVSGEKLIREFSNLENNDLNIIVLNFIDMLSHARTESKMIRELAASNAAYRSLTESWFRHSSALDLFRKIADKGYKIILTTDHGTIRAENPMGYPRPMYQPHTSLPGIATSLPTPTTITTMYNTTPTHSNTAVFHSKK